MDRLIGLIVDRYDSVVVLVGYATDLLRGDAKRVVNTTRVSCENLR